MLKTMLTIALMSCAVMTQAQDKSGDTYELRGNEQMGYVIDKDGNKTEGIVKLAGNEENPWMNQKKVKFIPKSSINPEKKRQKFKVLDAEDMQEYAVIEKDGTKRQFRKIKFTNKRESFGNSGGLGGKIKTIKNFASTTHMAEVILDGPITLYRLYGYPSPVALGKGDVEEAKKEEENLRENPDLLVQKNNGKPKELAVADIKGLVADCKVVSEKLASGAYSSYDPAKEEKKKSKFGKLVKSEFDRGGNKLLTMGLEIFTDYNTSCN